MSALQRSGGWPRKKRLQAKTPLSSSPLSRRTPLTPSRGLESGKGLRRSELISKRPTVTSAERNARKLVKARALGSLCERCGRRPGSEYCHRLARSQGGLWCPSNAWWGCSQCHRECHASPALAYEQGWHVRSTQNPAVVPMWVAGRGRVLLRADGSTSPYREAA